MEYNIGDKFVVVNNSGGIHPFELGDVVTYFKTDTLTRGMPAVDVVPYYDLDAIGFHYTSAVQGNLGYAFQWDDTPEGGDYWYDLYESGMTPNGQEKLDAMIKQYEIKQSLNKIIDVPKETVLDIMQELDDWISDDFISFEVPNGNYKEVTSPDGGPAKYYDLPPDAVTLNDLIEFKSYNQWLGDTAHLFNIFKAAWRWGIKEGTSKEYDARKFIYSGARLLMHYVGVEATREALQKMLDDKQFGGGK